MRYLSVCSGIEAATVAWEPLGWQPVAFSEIDKQASAVLQHHYPDVPNHGDFTTIKGDEYGAIDLIVGGTPCQSFSVAGLRSGLDDDRGNLALEFFRLIDRIQPRWFVWENVPGAMSSNGGRDFGAILGAMAEIGYGCAWRILDAQYIRTQSHRRAVPQRRRRVFVVGYLGDWRPPVAVLFESESLRGNRPPSRKTGQEVANTLTQGFGKRGGDDGSTHLEVVSSAVTSKWAKGTGGPSGDECQNLAPHEVAKTLTKSHGDGFNSRAEDSTITAFLPGTARRFGRPGSKDVSGALTGNTGDNRMAIAIQETAERENPKSGPQGKGWNDEGASYTLDCSPRTQSVAAAAENAVVRRLTPLECERLQGFPDAWTDIQYNGKPMSDSARYCMIGNSMAVNVMNWIGDRIELFEKLHK